MKTEGLEAHKNILFPKYIFDDRLKIQKELMPKPPATLYNEIGFDKDTPVADKPET